MTPLQQRGLQELSIQIVNASPGYGLPGPATAGLFSERGTSEAPYQPAAG